MKAILNFLALIIMMVGVSSCIETGSNEGSTFREIIPVVIDPNQQVSFEMLKTSILEPMCLRCHGWVSDQARVDSRITAGNPDSSALFRIVENGSMPVGGPALTLDQLDVVRRYITGKSGGGQNPPPAGGGNDNGDDNDDGDDDDDDDSVVIVEPTPGAVTFSELHTQVLAPKCVRCHGGMNTAEGLSEYIVAGNAESSLLYEVVLDGSMPRRSAPLNEEELLLVKNYIDSLGAR